MRPIFACYGDSDVVDNLIDLSVLSDSMPYLKGSVNNRYPLSVNHGQFTGKIKRPGTECVKLLSSTFARINAFSIIYLTYEE